MRKLYSVLTFLLVIALGALAGERLRISLAPILGSAPVLYGMKWGYFREEGVDLQIVPLASKRDMFLVFQTGKVDAVVADTAATVLLAARSRPVAVGTAYYPEDPAKQFVVIVDEDYTGIRTLDDLLTVLGERNFGRIALPLQSDLEFAMDTLLERHGIDPNPNFYFGQDNLIYVASLVSFGMVAAGVVPEPYASYVLAFAGTQGIHLRALRDFQGIPPLPHLIVFQHFFVREHPEAVRAFLRGFSRAVDRINAEGREGLINLGAPEVIRLFFQGLDPEKVLNDPDVQASIAAIPVPHFPLPQIPEREVFEAVSAWAYRRGYVALKVDYDQVVSRDFLP